MSRKLHRCFVLSLESVLFPLKQTHSDSCSLGSAFECLPCASIFWREMSVREKNGLGVIPIFFYTNLAVFCSIENINEKFESNRW